MSTDPTPEEWAEFRVYFARIDRMLKDHEAKREADNIKQKIYDTTRKQERRKDYPALFVIGGMLIDLALIAAGMLVSALIMGKL